MNFESILTPNSSNIFNGFAFSPFSCGIQTKQEMENLFEKGKEDNLSDTFNQLIEDNKCLDLSPAISNLEFPSPICIQEEAKIQFKNTNVIPIMELPQKIKQKLDNPKKKNKK